MEPILQIPLCISVCSRWWMAVWLVVQENAFAKVQKSVEEDGHRAKMTRRLKVLLPKILSFET